MWLKWLPWKFVLKNIARAQGFVDPINLLAKFNQFSQPSEVLAPVELLRAGAVMHARGLINSQVIQHNLDWVWPYWAERQFDPQDPSFIPRAFSVTQINLTHRNWTAVGLPGFQEAPVVDPRGLVMPFFDSWSIDAWVIAEDGTKLIPSRSLTSSQRLETEGNLRVITESAHNRFSLKTSAQVELRNGIPVCLLQMEGQCPQKGFLIVSLRPYNMEGISFIHDIRLLSNDMGWKINGAELVWFDQKPDVCRFACYDEGDVYHWTLSSRPDSRREVTCNVGMASAFAGYKLVPNQSAKVSLEIPLIQKNLTKKAYSYESSAEQLWQKSTEGTVRCHFPVKNYGWLFDTAVKTLVLHTPLDSYAGPYTYKRFWFRDAAFIVNSLLISGLYDRALMVIGRFFHRQTSSGYFLSQEGEWDSNGQALWAMARYCALCNSSPDKSWVEPIIAAARWIMNKRRETAGSRYEGLFPAGFSAEHLGPNDHYYWDDFWGVAGLASASYLLKLAGRDFESDLFERDRKDYLLCIEHSLAMAAGEKRRPAMPASPNRRLDSGSVGSLAAGYPLQIWEPSDQRLTLTANYLYDHCLIGKAFYHDISHSGINPYLSLHIAQVLLGAGDCKFLEIMDAIAGLASPTGQWPEAIHPQLKTGCMGDGQHAWAASEWISMVRNCFVAEQGEKLLLCQGILPEFFENTDQFSFGPAPTLFGPVSVKIKKENADQFTVLWEGSWFSGEPSIEVGFCGKERVRAVSGQNSITV